MTIHVTIFLFPCVPFLLWFLKRKTYDPFPLLIFSSFAWSLPPVLSLPTSHPKSLLPRNFAMSTANLLPSPFTDNDLDDSECPLCMEEIDISDRGFKPCPCGYQVRCRSPGHF